VVTRNVGAARRDDVSSLEVAPWLGYDHKKDMSEFKSEAKKAKDADVKDFAATTLPTLEEHLKLAQSAEQSAKAEGKAAATSTRPAATTSTRPAATKTGG
jgi:putative membrane protein